MTKRQRKGLNELLNTNNNKLALIQEYHENNRAKNYVNEIIYKVNITLVQKRLTKLPMNGRKNT